MAPLETPPPLIPASLARRLPLDLGPVGTLAGSRLLPRRHYDEEHVRLAAELARRAALAVDNARLYGEALDAVRARDEALAVVAHDLRSPLATIVMAADVLLQEGTAPALRTDIVRGIRRAARHANRLVAEYLDGARLAEGHVVLDLQATSIDALLAESVALVQRQADGAGLAVTLDLEAGLPPVRVDPDRMVEVFTNLLGNALKFTPAGGRVVVRARAGGDAVVCTVEDTGIGIPADALPHVFKRFWQSSGQRGRGAGLGLAICKGIVDAHGGRIWIESEPGAGTRVHFTLPVGIAPPPNG